MKKCEKKPSQVNLPKVTNNALGSGQLGHVSSLPIDVRFGVAPFCSASNPALSGFSYFGANLECQERFGVTSNEKLITCGDADTACCTNHTTTSAYNLPSPLPWPFDGHQDFYLSPTNYHWFASPDEHIPKAVCALDSSSSVVTASSGSPQGVELLQPPLYIPSNENTFLHQQPFLMQSLTMYYNRCLQDPFSFFLPTVTANTNHGYFCTEIAPPQNIFGQPILIPTPLPNQICPNPMFRSEYGLGATGEYAAGIGTDLRSTPSQRCIAQKCTDLTELQNNLSPSLPPAIPRGRKRPKPDESVSSLVDTSTTGMSLERKLRCENTKKANPSSSEFHLKDEVSVYEQRSIRYFNDGIEVDKYGNPLFK